MFYFTGERVEINKYVHDKKIMTGTVVSCNECNSNVEIQLDKEFYNAETESGICFYFGWSVSLLKLKEST